MADFYLNPAPLAEGSNWLNPLVQGYGVVKKYQNQDIQGQLAKQQLEQGQQKQAAMQQYGQSGDPNALRGVDPMMSAKLTDWLKSQPPENLKDIQMGTGFIQTIAPSINSKTWAGIKGEILKSYPKIPQEALPPDNATDQQLFQFANASKILDAQFKAMGQGPKVLKGGDMLAGAGGQVLAQAPLNPLQQAQAQKAKTGAAKDVEDIKNPLRKAMPQPFYNPTTKETIWVTPGSQIPSGFSLAKGGQVGGLTDETVDTFARNFVKTGELPPMGFGPQLRTQIFNKVPSLLKEGSNTPEDLAVFKTTNKALTTELTQLQGQRGKIMAFAITAEKNLELADQLSDKVGRTGVPVVNRWVNAGKRSISGDPDISAFDAAVRTAVNEYAKVTSSATGGGVTSDSARKEIDNMLNAAQTPEQIKSVLKTLRVELNNRREGYEGQIVSIKDSIKNIGKPGTGGQSKPQGGGNQSFNAMPSPSLYNGKTMRDTETGVRYKSNGTAWEPITGQ